MNQYGLPLTTPSVQTILPAIIQSGIVVGWYPIASHPFASFTLSDGTVVPITTVTKDNGMEGVQQYMAAVFPLGIANNYAPWASSLLIKPDAGYYRWWSLPTETWMLHFGYGTLLESLHTRLNISNAQPAAPGAPTVTTPAAITWQASIAFADLTGDCEFFDFNWITTFRASTTGVDPLRVVVVSNPAGTPPPLVAKVIGIPQATAAGPIYDTIRILRLAELSAGIYVFTFNVIDTAGQTTAVTFNLTVQ